MARIQSLSRCIHFLNVSQYADLGTLIRHWCKADSCACQDWYFRPARNYYNFRSIKKSHGARSREYWSWGKTVTFSFFKNAAIISEVWAGHWHVEDGLCNRASFLIIYARLLQDSDYVFVVLSSDGLPFITGTLIATLSPEKKISYQTFLALKDCLAIIGRLLLFSCPVFIANLFVGLKLMDPSFITCDVISKLLFVISLTHFKQRFGHFNPLSVLLFSQQMWHQSSKNLSGFQMLLQNKVNRW